MAFGVVVAWVVRVLEEPFRSAFVGDDVDALPAAFDVAVAVAAAAVVAAGALDEESGSGVSRAVDGVAGVYVEVVALEAGSVVEVVQVALEVCPDY